MSVIVKGMSLPERCDKCFIRHPGLARCQIAGRSTSHFNSGKPMDQTKRPKWCPLAELPETCATCEHYNERDKEKYCYKCTDQDSKWKLKEIESKRRSDEDNNQV